MNAAVAWEGKWIQVLVDGPWEYVKRTRDVSAAVILAVTDAGEVVLVEQERVPIGRRCLELPAGLVGDDTPGEAASASAERELEEETGFRAAHWNDLGEFFASPGMSAEGFRLFRATGLTRVGKGGGLEGHEDIAVHVVPLAEVPRFVAGKRAEGVAIDVKLLALLPHAA